MRSYLNRIFAASHSSNDNNDKKKRNAGEQESHWEKTNKGNYDFKWREHLDLTQVHCARRAKEKSQGERQLTTKQADTGNGL